MRRIAAAVSTVVLVLLSASLFAQSKPNLTGRWTMDDQKTAAANPAMAGGGGARMGGGGGAGTTTVTQDAATLTIEREAPNATKLVYRLDGSENKNMVNGRGGQTEQISKATIEGAKVVIRTQSANGEQVSSWYMEGDWLVSERPTQTGVMKTYFKKG